MYWYDAGIFPLFFEIHFFYPHLVPIVRDQTLTFSSPFSLKILGCILIYALRDMYHPFFGYFVFTPRAFPLLVLWTFTFTFFCTLYTLNSHHPFFVFSFYPIMGNPEVYNYIYIMTSYYIRIFDIDFISDDVIVFYIYIFHFLDFNYTFLFFVIYCVIFIGFLINLSCFRNEFKPRFPCFRGGG